MEHEAVILAGGRGKRMGSLTENQQKCLLPVHGRPMLGHVLDSLKAALGSARVTICVSYFAPDVVNYVNRNKPNGLEVDYVYDSGGQRTVDMFRALEYEITPPFIALAGDVVVESPSAYSNAMQLAANSLSMLGISVSPNIAEVDTHGIAKVEGGYVVDYKYPPPLVVDANWYRDMTIWGFGGGIFECLKQHKDTKALSKVIEALVSQGQEVPANLYAGVWHHFAYPEDLERINQDSSKPHS